MAVSMIGPKFYAWDRDGNPLAFGKVYTYKARTNAPKVTYTTEDSITANTNPVILNGEGYADIYLTGSYKVVVKDKDGNEIWTADPVSEAAGVGFSYIVTAYYASSSSFNILGDHREAFAIGARVELSFLDALNTETTVTASSFDGTNTVVEVFDTVVRTSITSAGISTGFSSLADFAELSTAQLEEQEEEFQNRFAVVRPAINWTAATLIDNPLQLYSTGTEGVSGYQQWLPDPNQLPFTTENTFPDDQVLNRWTESNTASVDYVNESSIKFDGLSSAVSAVTAKPEQYKRLSTASYRTEAECQGLGIDYPDGGGADYVVGTGFGVADGGSIIDAGSKQLKISNADIAKLNAKNIAAAWDKLKVKRTAIVIACVGDSMTAGHDVNSVDKITSPYGNPSTIAPIQYPSALQVKLQECTGVGHTTINRGYSGDTAKTGYNRWTTSPNADIAHIMYGINDVTGAFGATFEEYVEYMELNIIRHVLWGCGVVIHTSTLQTFGVSDIGGFRYTQAIIGLAKKYNCPIFESEDAVKNCKFSAVYSDSNHYTAHGYHRYGTALASFILAGGWVDRFMPVASPTFLTTGQGRGGAGYFTRGALLGPAIGSYLLDQSVAGIREQNDRISFSFYSGSEFADIYAVMFPQPGITIEIQDIASPTFVGDERGDGARSRFQAKNYQNRNIIETSKYTTNAGREFSGVGKLTHVGSLVGSGWKTISFYCESTIAAVAYVQGLYIEPSNTPISGGYHEQNGGRVSRAVSDKIIYQIPYWKGNEDSTVTPSAIALPASIDLPAPQALLPYQSRSNGYYDSIPVEIMIKRTGVGWWCKVLLHRNSGGNTLEIEEIASGVNGSTLIPTAASIVSAVFDNATDELGPVSGIDLYGAYKNQYLRLEFGATQASYYQIIVSDTHKQGSAEAGAVN